MEYDLEAMDLEIKDIEEKGVMVPYLTVLPFDDDLTFTYDSRDYLVTEDSTQRPGVEFRDVPQRHICRGLRPLRGEQRGGDFVRREHLVAGDAPIQPLLEFSSQRERLCGSGHGRHCRGSNFIRWHYLVDNGPS